MRSFIVALAVVALVAISSLVNAAVVELTSETYPTVTGDTTKSVFVMVHAVWCGHCIKLKPEFEKLAETFEGNDKIVLAKFDAPANEDYARNVLSIRSFPTLVFYKNGVKQDYAGARTKQGIEEFIKANI